MKKKPFQKVASWEQEYLKKPEPSDWKENFLNTDNLNLGPKQNIFTDILIDRPITESPSIHRDTNFEQISFLKKDRIKVTSEVISRIDRFFNDYKYSILDTVQKNQDINVILQLTQKTRNPKTIVAQVGFIIHAPRYLSSDPVRADKLEALHTFKCAEKTFPLNKRGFELAFNEFGKKYKDKHIVATYNQLLEMYSEQELEAGLEQNLIYPLDDKVCLCDTDFLNQLGPKQTKEINNLNYSTERHLETESDDKARLASIPTKKTIEEPKKEIEYKCYTQTGLLDEIKLDLGIVGEAAKEIVKVAVSQGLILDLGGSYLTEDKFSKIALTNNLIKESALQENLANLNKNYTTERLGGDYREDLQTKASSSSLIIKAKAQIDQLNKITSAECIHIDANKFLVKVATERIFPGLNLPVDYHFYFNEQGHQYGAYGNINNKKIDIKELQFLYQDLEKEALRQCALNTQPDNFKVDATYVDRDSNHESDITRILKSTPDLEKFASVKEEIESEIQGSVGSGYLTQEDVDILLKRLRAASRLSDLTQIKREYKTLSEIGEL